MPYKDLSYLGRIKRLNFHLDKRSEGFFRQAQATYLTRYGKYLSFNRALNEALRQVTQTTTPSAFADSCAPRHDN